MGRTSQQLLDLLLVLDDPLVSEHENYCGSRTEQCPECNDYVMLKDWEKHQSMRLYHGKKVSRFQKRAFVRIDFTKSLRVSAGCPHRHPTFTRNATWN